MVYLITRIFYLCCNGCSTAVLFLVTVHTIVFDSPILRLCRLVRPLKSKESGKELTNVTFEGRPDYGMFSPKNTRKYPENPPFFSCATFAVLVTRCFWLAASLRSHSSQISRKLARKRLLRRLVGRRPKPRAAKPNHSF